MINIQFIFNKLGHCGYEGTINERVSQCLSDLGAEGEINHKLSEEGGLNKYYSLMTKAEFNHLRLFSTSGIDLKGRIKFCKSVNFEGDE